MNFCDVFVLHAFELIHKAEVFGAAVGVFDEVLFEIHYVFVGSLFRAVYVNGPEDVVFGRLDQLESGGVTVGLRSGEGFAHLEFRYL